MSAEGDVGDNESSSLGARIEVEERGREVLEDFPSDIAEQLKRAAFDKKSANEYVKRRYSALGSSKTDVATVEIHDDRIVIEVEDVVGVVDFTPSSKLQINPKIGWDDILEIFLTVLEGDRSFDYQGVPIRQFLADDIGISDVFVIIAANYLESLTPLFKRGFVRDFETRRINAIDARGRIDIPQTLKNRMAPNGVKKQHFVQKDVDYDTPANALIYHAGCKLMDLFQMYADSYNHDGYYHIFAHLEDKIQRLENRGVTGESVSLSELARVSLHDLPRQRRYYEEALKVAKTILSSSIGEPLDQGQDELTMDYILGMEHLFEEYTQVVLERQLEEIQDHPFHDLEDATVDSESHQIFADTGSYTAQPDHVLRQDGEPIGIADTKYYAEGHDPVEDNWARSRLLSYAFRLETDHLAFLCPLGEETTHRFAEREGVLKIVSPSEFSVEAFEQRIYDYLADLYQVTTDSTLERELNRWPICVPSTSASSFDDIVDQSRLRGDNIRPKAGPILREVIRITSSVAHFENVPNYPGAVNRLDSFIHDFTEGYQYVVPLLVESGADIPDATINPESGEGRVPLSPDNMADRTLFSVGNEEDLDEEWEIDHERLYLHCFVTDEDDELTDWDISPSFVLNWL